MPPGCSRSTSAITCAGRLNTVLGWTRRLPEEIVAGSPRLCIEQGWALLFATRIQEMEAVLRHAELALAEEPGSLAGPGSPLPGQGRPEVERMRSTLAAMQAYTALSRGDAWQALALARRAAGGLPDARPWERVYIQMMLGYSSRAVGDLEQAATAFAESVRIARAGGNTFTLATSLNQLAYASRLRGRLRLAVDCYREALRCGAASGTTNLPYLSQMQAGLAGVLLEQNQVEEALALAREAVDKTRQWQSGNYIAWANLFLAQVLRARGDLPAAAAALAVADEARAAPWSCHRSARWSRRAGAPMARPGPGRGCQRDGPVNWLDRRRHAPGSRAVRRSPRNPPDRAAARVQIARGNPRREPIRCRQCRAGPVLPLLRCLEASAQASGRISALIEILTLKAAALWQAGGRARAGSAGVPGPRPDPWAA